MYRLTQDPSLVIRIEDGTLIRIPADESDGFAYQEWLDAGNTPAPALPPGVHVPQMVSRFQARAALMGAGLLETVEAYMALADTPAIQKLAWTDAQEFRRTSPTVAALGALMGLTSADLDALFITAASIEA